MSNRTEVPSYESGKVEFEMRNILGLVEIPKMVDKMPNQVVLPFDLTNTMIEVLKETMIDGKYRYSIIDAKNRARNQITSVEVGGSNFDEVRMLVKEDFLRPLLGQKYFMVLDCHPNLSMEKLTRASLKISGYPNKQSMLWVADYAHQFLFVECDRSDIREVLPLPLNSEFILSNIVHEMEHILPNEKDDYTKPFKGLVDSSNSRGVAIYYSCLDSKYKTESGQIFVKIDENFELLLPPPSKTRLEKKERTGKKVILKSEYQ